MRSQKKNILAIGLGVENLNNVQQIASKNNISVASVDTEFNSHDYRAIDLVVINDIIGSINNLVTEIKRSSGSVVVVITDNQDLKYRMNLLWAGCDKFIEDDSSLKYGIENIEIMEFDHRFKRII